MNDRTEDQADMASIPEDERWVHEPEFRKRFDSANDWMIHYIAIEPDSGKSNWMVLLKDFQCEIFALDDSVLNVIAKSLTRVSNASWATIASDSALEFRELLSMPGYYKVRLSDAHQAVIGTDGRQIFFLTLHCECPPEEFIVDPTIWSEVTSFDLLHNHEIPPNISIAEWKICREKCPKCRATTKERASLLRLATPIFVAMHSSNPYFKAREHDTEFWASYIDSGMVGAQILVAKHCGVFIPLQFHEKPDAKIAQYLYSWKLAHPGENPDRGAD